MKRNNRLFCTTAVMLLSLLLALALAGCKPTGAEQVRQTEPTYTEPEDSSWMEEAEILVTIQPFTLILDDGGMVSFDGVDFTEGKELLSFPKTGYIDTFAQNFNYYIPGGNLTVFSHAKDEFRFMLMRKDRSITFSCAGEAKYCFEKERWTAEGEPGVYTFKYESDATGRYTEMTDMLTIQGHCDGFLQILLEGEDLLVEGFTGETTAKLVRGGKRSTFTVEPGETFRVRFEDNVFQIVPQLPTGG